MNKQLLEPPTFEDLNGSIFSNPPVLDTRYRKSTHPSVPPSILSSCPRPPIAFQQAVPPSLGVTQQTTPPQQAVTQAMTPQAAQGVTPQEAAQETPGKAAMAATRVTPPHKEPPLTAPPFGKIISLPPRRLLRDNKWMSVLLWACIACIAVAGLVTICTGQV